MPLKELLGEDLYKQVMEKVGDNKIDIISNGNWIPKQKFNDLNDSLKDLKKQLQDRDTQLEDLKTKAAGNEDLQNTIKQLQDDNKKIKDDYEKQIQQQSFDFALKDALTGAKAKNPKAVEALLNKEAIKLDGDKLLGLEEQLNKLKESDSYLFDADQQQEQQQQSGVKFTTGQHQHHQGGNAPTSLADALAQRFSTNNQ
ncbi:scaffolding protein [Bacillus sp. 7586-K]|nr:scaffolding protein [Bacillus sp. 7586-K]